MVKGEDSEVFTIFYLKGPKIEIGNNLKKNLVCGVLGCVCVCVCGVGGVEFVCVGGVCVCVGYVCLFVFCSWFLI